MAPTQAADPRSDVQPGSADRPARSVIVTITVGTLVAIATLVLEVLYRQPPIPSDQINYLDAARDFPSVPTTFATHQSMRLGLVLPMRMALALFGYGQAAYYVVPMVAGIALAVGVFVLGTLLFNRAVGVGGAALTVGCAVLFHDLTQPLPDVLATASFCWAVVLAVALRQQHPATSATGRRQAVTLLAVGALLGWSYLTREYIVFVWPLILVLLVGRVRLARVLWILPPLVLVGLGEIALNGWLYGDPLARLHAAAGHATVLGEQSYGPQAQGRDREYLVTRFVAAIGKTPEGFFLKAAVAATVVGAVRSSRLRFLVLWAALLWVPLSLLGGLIDPTEPMLRLVKERYWYPMLPPLFLGGVGALFLLVRAEALRYPRLRARAALLGAVLALAGAAVPVAIAQSAREADRTYVANDGDQLGQLRTWLLRESQLVPVLRSDPRTSRMLAVWLPGTFGGRGWDGTVAALDSPAAAQPGEHIVVFAQESELCSVCRTASKAVFGSPATVPASWQPAFASSDQTFRVYRVPTG